MSKDVMAFEFNQHRRKHQRSNLLKSFLMGEEHVGEDIGHPLTKSTQVQTTTCIRCRHAFLNKEIPKGHHGCTACGQIYSPEQWTPRVLILHCNGSSYQKLICDICRNKGFTSRDTEEYTCTKCLKSRSCSFFDSVQIKNAKARKRKSTTTPLTCLDCRGK